MDATTFCTNMRDEMIEWKAKIYDLIRKTEKMSAQPDARIKTSIDEMGAMLGRIEETLETLEKECPVNWEAQKTEVDQMLCDVRDKWTEAAAMSPDDLE